MKAIPVWNLCIFRLSIIWQQTCRQLAWAIDFPQCTANNTTAD